MIGYNATGLGSNSVVLGNDSITTTVFKGSVGIGTTSPTSRLHGVTTLSADTGNEVAYELGYTTNKLTSGNDTGLKINMTDTASPGASYLLDLQVGGVSKGYVNNTGILYINNVSKLGGGAGLILQGNNLATVGTYGVTMVNGTLSHSPI